MQRTIKIRLQPTAALFKTIEIGNQIFREILTIGYKLRSYNKKELHNHSYKVLREKYPSFPSALLQTIRDVASETLKATKLRKEIKVKKHTSLRLDKRNIRINLKHRQISISSIEGRLKLSFNLNKLIQRYAEWKPQAATLIFRHNALYLHLIVEKETPVIKQASHTEIIGIDRGINNILVSSNNQFFNSAHLKQVKCKYQYLRKILQSKGTRSAKRKLKKISGRERRFVSDVNHRLSKVIAESDYSVFALEALQKMTGKSKGKAFNKKLGNWSFRQFETFLRYKAEMLGKTVLNVTPKYTSQICSQCNYCEKANRKLSIFKCRKCTFELHADLNAARNIAMLGKAELSRLQVNQPIVAPDEKQLLEGQLQTNTVW